MISACSVPSDFSDEMFALDTIISFKLYGADEQTAKTLVHQCKEEITRLENLLSVTLKSSDVYRINHSNGERVKVEDETAQLIRTALELSRKTDGAFDITVYNLVSLYGFNTKEYIVPSDESIKATLNKTGYKNISITDDNYVTLKNDVLIDLGGIAKGYIAQVVCDKIKSNLDVDSAIVNFGGMICTVGQSDRNDNGLFSIGIEYPDSQGSYFAVIYGDGATTSGSYQRYFEQDSKRYHHIIDTKTGKPADSGLSSVTIANLSDHFADGMSTAFFVMGADKTIEFIKSNKTPSGDNYSVVMLSDDKKQVYVTEDLVKKGFEIQSEYKDDMKMHVISLE